MTTISTEAVKDEYLGYIVVKDEDGFCPLATFMLPNPDYCTLGYFDTLYEARKAIWEFWNRLC